MLPIAYSRDCQPKPLRESRSGEDILSCTMIVSGASAWMEAYHDRMPVILTPDQFDRWLASEIGPEELKPVAEEMLRERMVSRWINKAGEGDDDPTSVTKEARCGEGSHNGQ